MPTVTITKDEAGKIVGASDKDVKKYAKWRECIDKLTRHESIIFSWKEPRSGPYHRRHFKMLGCLFAAQEQFQDEEVFRKWGEVGAGYCKLVPGSNGKPVAIPDSINYEKLDQAEFKPIHEAVFAFYRTLKATRFLWPHLSDQMAGDMVESAIGEFQ